MGTNEKIDRWDLIGICMDFFEAGGETVGSTLSWLFMFMSLNQDAQERCYMELKARLGNHNLLLKTFEWYKEHIFLQQVEEFQLLEIEAIFLIVMQPSWKSKD